MSEFDLITRHFANRGVDSDAIVLGIGDDAAILSTDLNGELIVSSDTLIEGVHFPARGEPEDIGYRALAVNLSDLAAMGASPLWAILALTIPDPDESWLGAFSRGFFSLANQYKVPLIGGDTTRGSLSMTVTVGGLVENGTALRRNTANAGDQLFVSGSVGDAAAGLAVMTGSMAVNRATDQTGDIDDYLLQRFWRPEPRIDLGLALRGLATAAIDVSDGLVADIGKLTSASAVGAVIDLNAIPISKPNRSVFDDHQAMQNALSGGDDYELCFAVAPADCDAVMAIADQVPVTRIGRLCQEPGVSGKSDEGSVALDTTGYDHFVSRR